MELRTPAGLEAPAAIGATCATAAALLTATWLVVLIRRPMVSADAVGELGAIAERPGLQIPRFAPTTLVAFTYLPMWLALAAVLWDGAPSAAVLAAGLGLLYPPLTASGYWLQYTTVRGLAEAADETPGAATAYELFGFHDRPTSVTANLVILGYAVWGLAGIAAGIGLLQFAEATAMTAAVLFLLTAALALIGAAGYVVRNAVLTAGVMASGVTSLGATIATGVLLFGTPERAGPVKAPAATTG